MTHNLNHAVRPLQAQAQPQPQPESLLRQSHCQHRTQAGGFAAIAAMFLLVVLAGLGAFMVSFSNAQQLSAAQDIQGTRAYWAARAGLDWAIAAVVANPSACPLSPPTSANTGSSFSLTLVCTPYSYLEGGATVQIYVFESRASTSPLAIGSLGFVERSLSASYEVPQ